MRQDSQRWLIWDPATQQVAYIDHQVLSPESLPGSRWATLITTACEWSGPTRSAQCFGQRQPGTRVRLMAEHETRWLIWDPATADIAYIDADVLQAE